MVAIPVRRVRLSVLLSIVAVALGWNNVARAASLWDEWPSVKASLLASDGDYVVCRGVRVQQMAARNNPPYLVVGDFGSDSRIVVLCRPPLDLSGGCVDAEGIMGSLPSGERCIRNAVIYGYFDSRGRPACLPPFPSVSPLYERRVLASPTGSIPRSDPSLPDDGLGIAGVVTAVPPTPPLAFGSVASLLAAHTSVMSTVSLQAKPIRSVGAGFVVMGDNEGGASIKVYTSARAEIDDRIVSLTGSVHTEDNSTVLYCDSGPAPFFDVQAINGQISIASPGSVAYAASLPDGCVALPAVGCISANSSGVTDVSIPQSGDQSCVYLTGRVVTYSGKYYSYASTPPGFVNVFNIQGLDGLPGMRVYGSSTQPSVGSIVDVMGVLGTRDGQRTLGEYGAAQPVELSVLALPSCQNGVPLNIVPVGMNNRELGGCSVANNPGISPDGYGLYKVGSYVTVWGRVLESGPRSDLFQEPISYPYQFDHDANDTVDYMRIDDGAGVPSANSYDSTYGDYYGDKGVIVFGANHDVYDTQSEPDDFVAISGVAAVWRPRGSANSYRCIWTSDPVQDLSYSGTTRSVQLSGDISGTITVYDVPADVNTVVAHVWTTAGRSQSVTITRTGNPSSSWSGVAGYTLTVPKEVLVATHNSLFGDNTETVYPQYIVSATCEGYKTRTFTGIAPDTTRNICLTPLRKITLRTQNNRYSIGCASGPLGITATVRSETGG